MAITWRPTTRKKPALAATALVVGLSALVGCGHHSPSGPTVQTEVPTSAPTSVVTLRVYVADTLRGAFKDIARVFETGHPGTNIQLTFGSSASLVDRIGHDGTPDILAVAEPSMEQAESDGLVKKPVKFATNRLTIVVPPGNPHAIRSFDDLGHPGLRVAVCQEQLPCGQATSAVATSLGMHLNPASTESSAKDVIEKVASGAADAGVVYVTDAKAAGDKIGVVNFSEALVALETYSIATTTGAANPDRADQFVDGIKGDASHRIIADAGFERP